MCKINGKKLEELRVQAGMTKAELAKMLGVSGQTITNYENGKVLRLMKMQRKFVWF